MPTLPDFEGMPVRQAGAEVPGLAGGLRDAMKIDPEAYHQGTKVFIITEAVAQKTRFDPIDSEDPGGDQRRVHVFKAAASMILAADDADDLRSMMETHREKVRQAKEDEAGITRLFDKSADQLALEHANGDHNDDPAEGCPVCDFADGEPVPTDPEEL